MNYKEAIVIFIILLTIIFIVDLFLINKRKLKKLKENNKKKKTIGELDYLVVKYKLNSKKLNKERVIIWISFINSFIIATVSSIIMILPFKLIWQLLIAFALLFGLIYSLYEIYGRHLKKLEEKTKKKKVS